MRCEFKLREKPAYFRFAYKKEFQLFMKEDLPRSVKQMLKRDFLLSQKTGLEKDSILSYVLCDEKGKSLGCLLLVRVLPTLSSKCFFLSALFSESFELLLNQNPQRLKDAIKQALYNLLNSDLLLENPQFYYNPLEKSVSETFFRHLLFSDDIDEHQTLTPVFYPFYLEKTPLFSFFIYPTELACLVITQDKNKIDSIEFLAYDKTLTNPLDIYRFSRLGLLNEKKCLKSYQLLCSSVFYDQPFGNNLLYQSLKKELDLYFQGQLKSFETPIVLTGTAFQCAVWNEILKIPCSQTRSYKFVAASLLENNPELFFQKEFKPRRWARPVAAACSENPVMLLVPCHRVIGENGRILGFRTGVAQKSKLLLHENFSFRD